MSRRGSAGAGVWLLRGVGVCASVGLVLALAGIGAAMRNGTWLAIADLATLELTVAMSLGVAAASAFARGRRALQLDDWTRAPTGRRQLQQIALLWCGALAAVLGALPGLALGLAPPAVWPLGLVGLALVAAPALGSPRRRVAWLLCATYGLGAAASLFVVRHVF